MTDQPRSGLPILGQLSMPARIFLIATVVLSVVAIVLDFGLHADETVLFVVSAAAILGLAWVVGLSTERLGSLTGPQVGGILNATFGNIAELIIAFFALQAGPDRGRQGVADRLDHREPAPGHGRRGPARRPAPRYPDVQLEDRRREHRAPGARAHRVVRAGDLRHHVHRGDHRARSPRSRSSSRSS